MKLLFAVIIAVIVSGSTVLSQTCAKVINEIPNNTYNPILTDLVSSPSKTITISSDFQLIEQNCMGISYLFDLYAKNGSDANVTHVFGINFDCNSKTFEYTVLSSNYIWFKSQPFSFNFNVSMSIDLNTGNWTLGLWTDRDMVTSNGKDDRLVAYTFDSSTQLRICNGQSVCDYNVKYVNTFISNPELLLRLDKSQLIGSYQFQEGVGASSKNLQPNSTTNFTASPLAVFGTQIANYADSPQWLASGPGVAFTSTDQSITIPSIPCPQIGRSPLLYNYKDLFYGFSTGLSVWLKIETVPTSEQAIFRYLRSTQDEQASIRLQSDAKIKVMLQDTNRTSTSTFPIKQWTQLTVLLNLYTFYPTDDSNCFISMYIGSELQTAVPSSCNKTGYEVTLSLIIGGFVGQMQDLLIFGTPAYYTTPSTCSSAVSMSLGNSNPDISLLRSACDDRMLVGRSSSCYSCSDVITSCNDDLSARTCLQGYFINGSICSKCDDGSYSKTRDASECSGACPNACSTCFNSSSCQVCRPGYSLQGGQCVQCSPGTYALSGSSGACTETCPSSCATCTNQTYCDSCNTGFGLSSNQCIVCPEGTYATPTSCAAKESKSGIGSVVMGLILFVVVLALVFFGYRYIQRRRAKSAEGSQEPKAELALAFVRNPSANTTQSSQIQL